MRLDWSVFFFSRYLMYFNNMLTCNNINFCFFAFFIRYSCLYFSGRHSRIKLSDTRSFNRSTIFIHMVFVSIFPSRLLVSLTTISFFFCSVCFSTSSSSPIVLSNNWAIYMMFFLYFQLGWKKCSPLQ